MHSFGISPVMDYDIQIEFIVHYYLTRKLRRIHNEMLVCAFSCFLEHSQKRCRCNTVHIFGFLFDEKSCKERRYGNLFS